jgi:hypothetical protein
LRGIGLPPLSLLLSAIATAAAVIASVIIVIILIIIVVTVVIVVVVVVVIVVVVIIVVVIVVIVVVIVVVMVVVVAIVVIIVIVVVVVFVVVLVIVVVVLSQHPSSRTPTLGWLLHLPMKFRPPKATIPFPLSFFLSFQSSPQIMVLCPPPCSTPAVPLLLTHLIMKADSQLVVASSHKVSAN